MLTGTDGEKVAALCADFDMDGIRKELRDNVLDILVIIMIIGLLFVAAGSLFNVIRLLQAKKNREG